MEAGPERLRAGEGQLSCSILLSDGRPAADFSNCSCDTTSSPSVFSLSTSSSFPYSTALSRNHFTLFLPYELINLLTSSVSSSRLTASQNVTAPKPPGRLPRAAGCLTTSQNVTAPKHGARVVALNSV